MWALVRGLMRWAPTVGLRAMMRSLSTQPPAMTVDALSQEERATLAELFARMGSGHGFTTDLAFARQSTSATISQPTLVVASRNDRAVPLAQAESLNAHIETGTLMVAETNSHFLWFGPGSAEVTDRIRVFLGDIR